MGRNQAFLLLLGKNYFCYITVFSLNLFCFSISLLTVNKHECKEPLGMYTGAIAKSDISCDHEHFLNDANKPECGQCKNARYKVDQLPNGGFWCIDYSAVSTAKMDISFHYLTYVNNMQIEAFTSNQLCTKMEIHYAINPAEYTTIQAYGVPKLVIIYFI